MKINRENKRKAKIIKNLANNITVLVTVISLFIIATISLNNKTIVKDIKESKTKPLEQEGQTYRLVTSADNVQVAVPKGYVASEVSGENYVTPEYRHTINTYKVESTPTQLTWSSPVGEAYPWTQDENGIWISGNQGIPSSTSTLESEEFTYIKGTTLTINYTYSSQSGDYLNIDLINVTNNTTTRIENDRYGNTSTSFNYTTSIYTYTADNWVTGRYKIKATFSKNGGADGGKDSGYIKPSTYFKEDENGTETIEVDQKTKIHDGGFVIYQLTDEEIETDPNGTNVIIDDTNKDDAQSERSQYVWVPVENVEDLVRTKSKNNGIMQFGQGYIFSDTGITKETNTGTDYFREPRLVEQYDKNKYYLQRYIDINNRQNYLNKQQDDFARMIESINKYKGFYIGRYETGDEVSHSGSFKKPKIVRYNSNINYVTWHDSYKDLQRLSGKTGKYVETGMIYDTMWDYTLKWLNETDTRSYEDIRTDSGTWGNYSNNTKTTSSGGTSPAGTGAIETITYKGETYSDSPTASNNIFDLAGNVWEWTRSRGFGYERRIRGGYCGSISTGNPAYDIYYGIPYRSYDYYGVRSVLLIK